MFLQFVVFVALRIGVMDASTYLLVHLKLHVRTRTVTHIGIPHTFPLPCFSVHLAHGIESSVLRTIVCTGRGVYRAQAA
jgi:hypothetical protein